MPSRGELWKIDWSRGDAPQEPVQMGHGVVIQNDHGNMADSYPFTLVAAVGPGNREIPIHVPLSSSSCESLPPEMYVRCEQVLMVQKSKLVGLPIGRLTEEDLQRVNEAIKVSLGLP